MFYLEVCSADLQSAWAAYQGGASRVELCDNLTEGGTTPSLALIEAVRHQLPILLNVLIRPRGGDFVYDEAEIALMKQDIKYCASLGCDGVVLGALQSNGEINQYQTAQLVEVAKQHQLTVTFHRAFDCCVDLTNALETLIQLQCDTVLTSGGYDSVGAGKTALAKLVAQAANRIEIMAGSGVTLTNLVDIVTSSGVNWIHGSFRKSQLSQMSYINPKLTREAGMYDTKRTDVNQIKQAITLLSELNLKTTCC